MRLLLTALRCAKGDPAGNLVLHRDLVERGAAAGCGLVLFPEMSLTGSGPDSAVTLEHPSVRDLVTASAGGPAICFGLAESVADERPWITQVVAAGGSIVQLHRKAGVAPDEQDHYRAGVGSGAFELDGTAISLAVCAEIGLGASYRTGASLVLGPAAPGLYGRRNSPDDWRRGFDWWRGSVLDDAAKWLRPGSVLAVSTQAGATEDEDFPGWCALVASGGRVVGELADWQEGSLVIEHMFV
jgi:predicted amidohydrolase